MDSLSLIAAHAPVSGWITGLFGFLLVALIVSLALEEKIHAKKSIIVGAFAVICLLLGTLTGIIKFQNVIVGSYEVQTPNEQVELNYIVDPATDEIKPATIGGAASRVGQSSGPSGWCDRSLRG